MGRERRANREAGSLPRALSCRHFPGKGSLTQQLRLYLPLSTALPLLNSPNPNHSVYSTRDSSQADSPGSSLLQSVCVCVDGAGPGMSSHGAH